MNCLTAGLEPPAAAYSLFLTSTAPGPGTGAQRLVQAYDLAPE
jgi:hypothetical protein